MKKIRVTFSRLNHNQDDQEAKFLDLMINQSFQIFPTAKLFKL